MEDGEYALHFLYWIGISGLGVIWLLIMAFSILIGVIPVTLLEYCLEVWNKTLET